MCVHLSVDSEAGNESPFISWAPRQRPQIYKPPPSLSDVELDC